LFFIQDERHAGKLAEILQVLVSVGSCSVLMKTES